MQQGCLFWFVLFCFILFGLVWFGLDLGFVLVCFVFVFSFLFCFVSFCLFSFSFLLWRHVWRHSCVSVFDTSNFIRGGYRLRQHPLLKILDAIHYDTIGDEQNKISSFMLKLNFPSTFSLDSTQKNKHSNEYEQLKFWFSGSYIKSK